MKDKVLRLKDNSTYYILDELAYNDSKYIFVVECDSKADTCKDIYSILEMTINENKLVVKNVNDFNILQYISNIFLSRLKDL